MVKVNGVKVSKGKKRKMVGTRNTKLYLRMDWQQNEPRHKYAVSNWINHSWREL